MGMLSFVIPCYRSEKTVAGVIGDIVEKVAERPEYDYEIVAVNDGSPDNVMEVLRREAEKNPRVKVLDLAVNVGKHAAVLAGYGQVQGEYVVNVDDDGQCPVERLWDLLAPLEQGHDMAMARYGHRAESSAKSMGSRVNDWMSRTFLGKPKGLTFSNFIARRLFVCKAMAQYDNVFPYLEGLSLRVTKDVVTVPMTEHARRHGKSGYTLKKSFQLWLNGFTTFSVKPLRTGYLLGLFNWLVALILLLVALIRHAAVPGVSVAAWSVSGVVFLCSGTVLLMLGFMGEYLGRANIGVNRYPQYVIREKINCADTTAKG